MPVRILLLAAALVLITGPAWADDGAPLVREPSLTSTLRPVRTPAPEPRGAEDYRAESHVPIVPEPMVFDLVRGLGARRGELEINALGEFPVGDNPNEVLWAPEIEAAIADGFALEFELPFEGTELEAYKFAAQVTFGTADCNRFIHGAQLLVERFVDDDIWENTLTYIPAYRWNRTWSVLAMIGMRQRTGDDAPDGAELIFNLSVFADVGASTTLGPETNYESRVNDEGASLLLMPQIHVEFTEHVMLQAGAGVRFENDEVFPERAARLIYTF